MRSRKDLPPHHQTRVPHPEQSEGWDTANTRPRIQKGYRWRIQAEPLKFPIIETFPEVQLSLSRNGKFLAFPAIAPIYKQDRLCPAMINSKA
jgi:hypothetical protein